MTPAEETAGVRPRTPPDGIALHTPGDWITVDLAELSDRARAAGMVDARIEEAPALAEHRAAVIDLVVRGAGVAAAVGVDHTAILATEEDGAPMLASLILSHHDRPREDGSPPAPADHPPPMAGSAAIPDEVEEVLLGVGTCGRQEYIVEGPAVPGQPTPLLVVVRYFIPVPATSAMAILTFSSPTVGHRLTLVRLFHAIADELRFTWNDEGVERPPARGIGGAV